MKRQLLFTLTLVTILTTPVFGQLASPNAIGVAIGHIHLNVSDMDVQQKFWTDLGGKIVNRERIVMVQFPGRVLDPSNGNCSDFQSIGNSKFRIGRPHTKPPARFSFREAGLSYPVRGRNPDPRHGAA